MLYFAYGSNMSSPRLLARIPRAENIGTGAVSGHVLKFHKISQIDGSGKCDIYKTNKPGDRVRGVLYKVSPDDKKNLDQIEGLGIGYKEKIVAVLLDNGEERRAFVYYAITIDPLVLPLDWYIEHVLQGALENNLPDYYIAAIKKVRAVADIDKERYRREMALYL